MLCFTSLLRYLHKAPELEATAQEIFICGESLVVVGTAGVTTAVIDITVQPQAKVAAIITIQTTNRSE